MLDIFVREALTARTLCQAHALSQRLVICFAVCRVQCAHWIATLNTYRHVAMSYSIIESGVRSGRTVAGVGDAKTSDPAQISVVEGAFTRDNNIAFTDLDSLDKSMTHVLDNIWCYESSHQH